MADETAEAWRARSRTVFEFVRLSERQLSSSLHFNAVSTLAAADQLSAATRVALAWVRANPCPDPEMGSQTVRMLRNCAEVALTAQRVASDPTSNTRAARSRLENLAAVVQVDVQTLEHW